MGVNGVGGRDAPHVNHFLQRRREQWERILNQENPHRLQLNMKLLVPEGEEPEKSEPCLKASPSLPHRKLDSITSLLTGRRTNQGADSPSPFGILETQNCKQKSFAGYAQNSNSREINFKAISTHGSNEHNSFELFM